MNIQIEEILPIIIEQIKDNKTISLTPNGNSMKPTIIGGKDVIFLSSFTSLNKYDIVLYKYQDHYSIHRIIKINKDNTYNLCGDNNLMVEKNVSINDIVGLVIKYTHDEKEILISDKKYHSIGRKIEFKKKIRRIFR